MALPRVARHEAAHACAGIYLGESVLRAEINKRTHKGFVEHKCKGRRIDPLRLAIICLAGDAAERMFYRASRTRHSWGDMRNVLSMGFRGRSIDTLMCHADGIVHELREPIERVAAGLLEHGRLKTGQIHRLYHGVQPMKKTKKKKGGRPCAR